MSRRKPLSVVEPVPAQVPVRQAYNLQFKDTQLCCVCGTDIIQAEWHVYLGNGLVLHRACYQQER